MTIKEIKALTDSELIYELVMNDRKACNEVNSRRGLTKKTDKTTNLILAECKERGLLSEEHAQKIIE